MKSLRSLLFSITCSALLVGCASSEMKKFVGKPSSDVIVAWGSPRQKTQDDHGRETWVYQSVQEFTSAAPVRVTPYSASPMLKASGTDDPIQILREASAARDVHSYILERTFYIDSNGTVIGYAVDRHQ